MTKKGLLLSLTVFFLLLALFLVLTASLNYESPAAVETKHYLGFSVPDDAVLLHTDSHDGFHGDGETFMIFTVTPEIDSRIRRQWIKVSENAQLTSFLSEKKEYNGSGFFPAATKDDFGLFLDRSPEGQPNRMLNFVAAVYQPRLGKVYYYRFDS